MPKARVAAAAVGGDVSDVVRELLDQKVVIEATVTQIAGAGAAALVASLAYVQSAAGRAGKRQDEVLAAADPYQVDAPVVEVVAEGEVTSAKERVYRFSCRL